MRVVADILARSQRMELPGGEEMGQGTRLRFVLGWYERESVHAVARLVFPGMTVLDVGAHVGYYTRRLSRRVGPTGHVIALEPHSPTFKLLAHNLPPARFGNVRLLHVAAGETPGEAPILEYTGSGKHSFFDVSIYDSDYRALGTSEIVRVARLDDLLGELGIRTVQFVKLDIEGAELDALRGMRGTLAASPALAAIIEYNARAIRAAGGTANTFVSELRGHGFDLAVLDGAGRLEPLPENADDLPPQNYINLLAVKGMSARHAFADPAVFRTRSLAAALA